MEIIVQFLRRRILSSTHEVRFFEEEISRIIHTIRDTVINGVSNSMLIIGRRGSGKRSILRKAIEKAEADNTVKDNLIEIRINGLIHTDDRLALHAMAKQLHRVSADYAPKEDFLKKHEAESNSTEEEGSTRSGVVRTIKMRSFADNLRWLLTGLREGSSTTSKALLLILEEFDLFAAHRNQALLYNLLDISCHAEGAPICVIGVTCRLDIMEMLEKRVKSRFSHRQLHVIPVTAPRLTDASVGIEIDDSNSVYERNSGNDGQISSFQRYCLLAASLLQIDDSNLLQQAAKQQNVDPITFSDLLTQWNDHVESFFQDELVRDCLRQTWEVSTCVKKLTNVIALLVARLNNSKVRLEANDFINVLSHLRQDAKTSQLPNLSLLELILITVMVKLQDIRGQLINLEVVFNEYSRFCKTNCPAYFYEKRVVSKAIDNLVQLELVVSGHEAVAAVTVFEVGALRRPCGASRFNAVAVTNLPTRLRRFQPIICFVSTPLLIACLDTYPGCPIELIQWAHSRTI